MPSAYELIPPVDQYYADHMEFIAVKYDFGFTLWFGVVIDINEPQNQVAKVVIGFLTVLPPH